MFAHIDVRVEVLVAIPLADRYHSTVQSVMNAISDGDEERWRSTMAASPLNAPIKARESSTDGRGSHTWA
jgi:hypothetical protein